MRRLAPVFLVTTLACSGAQKKKDDGIEQDPITFEDPEGADAGAGAADTSVLAIVPMTITDGQNDIFLREDGTVEAGGQKLFVLDKKGECKAANGGLYATLNADGSITGSYVTTDKFGGVSIQKDGSITRGGETMAAVDEEGKLKRGDVAFLQFKGPEQGRQAATFIYVMLAALQSKAVIPDLPEEKPDNPCGAGDHQDGKPGGGESASGGNANPCN